MSELPTTLLRSSRRASNAKQTNAALLSTRIVSDIRSALYPSIETADVIRNCDTLN
jgi:hypothetical protein